MQTVKVLVVEDNLINQKVIASMLNMFHTEVEMASSGEEGLKYSAQNSYDLILMDFQLPNLNGAETTKLFRQQESDSKKDKTIVLALTAEVFKENEVKCLESGMDGFLTKPIRMQTLVDSLRKYGIHLDRKSKT